MEKLNCRILNRRVHGRSAFLDVLASGDIIQSYLNNDLHNFEEVIGLPLGSFIRIEGEYFLTRTGHNTLRITNAEVLHIPTRILPVIQDNGENRFNDITDRESVRRQRYLQTILNPEERKVFITRSRLISLIRNFFIEYGYLEVETPILQNVYGGAEANPFITRFEYLDSDFYLRIAPELYLRRMIIGGYDRVFEIGKNFRNEGISNRHNPEFTFMEAYTAFEDYMFSMDLVSDLFTRIFNEFGVVQYQGSPIDLSRIDKRSYYEMVSSFSGRNSYEMSDEEVVQIFESEVESTLINPTIVYDYPSSVSPLSNVKSENPRIAERFEIYIGGMEIGNAYSELNNVESHIQNVGDEDIDFINALEYGMPPTTGIGLGIDRLVMLITDRPIRDVIFFPAMRRSR